MKKFISIFLVIIMLSTLLPVSGSAMVDCTVTDNIIDITDKVVYERKGLGSAKVTNLKVENADVESATEEEITDSKISKSRKSIKDFLFLSIFNLIMI